MYNNNIIKDKNSISNNNKKQDPVTIKKTKLKIEYKALREKITITAKKKLNHISILSMYIQIN